MTRILQTMMAKFLGQKAAIRLQNISLKATATKRLHFAHLVQSITILPKLLIAGQYTCQRRVELKNRVNNSSELFCLLQFFLFSGTSIGSSLPEYLRVFHILVLENFLQYKECSHVLSYSLQVRLHSLSHSPTLITIFDLKSFPRKMLLEWDLNPQSLCQSTLPTALTALTTCPTEPPQSTEVFGFYVLSCVLFIIITFCVLCFVVTAASCTQIIIKAPHIHNLHSYNSQHKQEAQPSRLVCIVVTVFSQGNVCFCHRSINVNLSQV